MSTEAGLHTIRQGPAHQPLGGRTIRVFTDLPFLALLLGLVLVSAVGLDAQVGGEIPHISTLPALSESPFPYVAPGDIGVSPEAVQELVELVRGWIADGDLVGAEILLLKERQVFLHEALGWRNREEGLPMQRNSIFRIRSMTKPFTATAIFLLVEDGRVSLDDPVSAYLESWRNEASGEITIHQLLSHTGGFVQGGFPQRFQSYSNLREAVDDVGRAGPQNPVGGRYEYSDVGSATLGALVEAISGMPVERFIEDRILEPLGLEDTHTRFSPNAPWASRMNPTYARQPAGNSFVQYWHPREEQSFPFFRASGGLYTTVFDYSRWLTVFLDLGAYPGGRLLGEETVREAIRPAASRGYGLHWEIFSPLPEEGGLPTFGHTGSDGTLAVAFPSEKGEFMVLLFTQSRGAGVIRRILPAFWAGVGQGGGSP